MFHVKHEGLLARYSQFEDGLTAYAHWLETAGIERGLLGPREVDRIWDRHIANCAVIEELIPLGATVYDVGSGAGLPGLPIAIVRPDLKLTLIEPLLRRATFLTEVIADLDLGSRVQVVRARAEVAKLPKSDVVTARAVAPLTKLLTWTLPMVKPGGMILAMKGSSVEAEIDEAQPIIKSRPVSIHYCGQSVVDPLTTVVKVMG